MITKKRARIFSPATPLGVVLIGCLFISSLFMFQPEAIAYSDRTPQAARNAKEALSLANFYYSSNDTTDITAQKYRIVITKYPNTKEAEAAQYYLASYYHRKYYIRKEKWREPRKDSLAKAELEYNKYIKKYSKAKSPQWLTDARFNLALDYFEQDSFSAGLHHLAMIIDFEAARDSSIYVHQLIWSGDPKSVIDQTFNAKQLAVEARKLAQLHQSARGFEAIVQYLSEWCRTQGSQQVAK